MENFKENIDFLNKLSNILGSKISPITTISSINKLFKNSMNIQNLNIVIWDDNNMMLKDFVQDWKLYDDSQTNEINFSYTNLSDKKGCHFYFNGNEFDCEITQNQLFDIEELTEENNTILYPLVANGEVFGLMNISAEKRTFKKNFFNVLNISSKLISGAIINYLLNEQMGKSLNFYKAMKDIAKILESQYELSYIIPLIGEMIDRFMSSHLIYIFSRQDNKYNLVWPNACKDKDIYKLLDKINFKTEYIMSENSRIGVFPILNEENILGAVVAYSNIEKLLQKDIDYLLIRYILR